MEIEGGETVAAATATATATDTPAAARACALSPPLSAVMFETYTDLD
jgi:hypothetical protein